MNAPDRQAVVAVLATAALVAAALFAGGRAGAAPRDAQPARAPAWLQEIEQGADHIDAVTLADELLAARNDVVVVDVRPADEFAAWHLPGAVNLDVPDAVGAAGEALFARNPRLVVLCSNGPAHPGQAWVELRRQGHDNVRVLDGGLDEFRARVLTPPSLRDGASEATTKADSAASRLRRAFFLGVARPTANVWASDPAQLSAPTVVSTRWLAEHLGKVAVLDVRESAADYAALHLPGALHVPVASLRQRSGDRDLLLIAPEQLAARFGALGLHRELPVVLCGDDKIQDATMAAAALVRCGHRALALLEGGIVRWASERRPLVRAVPTPVAAVYEPLPGADDFSIGTDDVAAQWRQGTAILDVRPPAAFAGRTSTEARAGHIPGARNRLFSTDLRNGEDGATFRPRAELERDYAALGLKPEAPLVVHCRTGHTASESWFVLRWLLGYRQVRFYNGSWTEWAARADLPAVTGDGKEDKR